MHPAASVCGWCFGSPQARTSASTASAIKWKATPAKGMSVAVERWLSPNANYDPAG